MKILLVEDNRRLASALGEYLEGEGFSVAQAHSLASARKKIQRQEFDAIVTDLKLPDGQGSELIEDALETSTPIILITAYGDIRQAVEAIKRGAFHFIEKPVDPDYLRDVLQRAVEGKILKARAVLFKETSPPVEVVGSSPAFLQAFSRAKKAAEAEITVLLTGETGVGKEVFARAIHSMSRRKNHPFVAINCASIPETLLESELFGYERGAFTGATRTKPGRIELARGGTLFLDEIAEMSPALQAKLLRVLEEKKIERLGGTREIEVDVRFIVATNKDLAQLVREGKFRQDLYYRLSVFPIEIPPLRERKEDIIPLAEHFLALLKEEGKPPKKLTEGARKKLLSYSWPGNVRELKNVLERASVLSDGPFISEKHIVLQEASVPLDLSGTLEEAVERAKNWAEREKIYRTLKACGGDIKKAASILGISPKTLYAKIKKHGLE